jgi:hypothetical protein
MIYIRYSCQYLRGVQREPPIRIANAMLSTTNSIGGVNYRTRRADKR